ARRDVLDQIRAAGHPFGRWRESSVRDGPRPRAHERPPPDGEGNSGDKRRDQCDERPLDDVQHVLHVMDITESLARAFLNDPYRDANFVLAGSVGPIWPDLV